MTVMDMVPKQFARNACIWLFLIGVASLFMQWGLLLLLCMALWIPFFGIWLVKAARDMSVKAGDINDRTRERINEARGNKKVPVFQDSTRTDAQPSRSRVAARSATARG